MPTMATPVTSDESRPVAENVPPATLRHPLPSGHILEIHGDAAQSTVEVRNPDGAVEVTIRLTDSGPEVRVAAKRLEVETPREVAFRCESFQVKAEQNIHLQAGEEMLVRAREARTRTVGDVFVNGRFIRLNSPDAPA